MNSNGVGKQLLKDGINELYDRSKISSTLKDDAEEYIDDLNEEGFYNLKYSEFNQDDSENVTFDDANREVTWDSGSAKLYTNAIELSNIKIKALKLKGSDENVTWKLSTTGTTSSYMGLESSYDLDEEITSDSFYLEIDFSSTNTIKGLIVVYENL